VTPPARAIPEDERDRGQNNDDQDDQDDTHGTSNCDVRAPQGFPTAQVGKRRAAPSTLAGVATYEYRCPTCETHFEVRRPMSESSSAATCPDGHAGGVRLLSVFASVSSGSATGAMPAPGPSTGMGCGAGCACH